jgi:hypothetical protein
MTTATIDQPETTQATPAPPTPARPGPWATNAQRTLATYLKPLEVLTPPTAGTCLDDLLDVRAVLAPGEADPVNAAALVKARIRSEGGPDQLARDLATKIARERQMERGRVEFSNTKVVELTELILEMLTAVDVAIGLAVAERPDPRIIRVADFGPQGITSVYCPEYSYAATGAQGVYLCAGIVEHLPDDHPLHQDFSMD